MNRREAGHLAAVIAVAAAFRAVLFPYVGIWGDYGFYIYDSRLILQGGVPFVDFLGRSPLFNYAFAAVRAVFGNPIPLLRVFISALWLLTIIPVYAIARLARDHRTAIVAVALFAWLPFGLVYGMWANTQSLAALLGVTGVYAILRWRDWRGYAAAGVLFGLAFLSRRSIIVIVFAALLYTGWRWLLQDHDRLLARPVALLGGFGVALAAVYGAMVGGDPERMWALFEVHTINLFASYGRGGYPLITMVAPIVTNAVTSGRIPIFNDLCQTCGAWTARTMAKTLLAALPMAGVLAPYLRGLTDRYFDRTHLEYLWGVLGVLGLYAAAMALWAGFYLRVLAIVALALFVVVAYRGPRVSRDVLYNRRLQLVVLISGGMAAGYLYRNRVLHTYYFMDLWPYLAILGGVALTALWGRAERPVRGLLSASLILAVVTSGVGAHPVTNVVLDDNDDGWFTMDNIHDFRDDINNRTEPGDIVYTTSPAFLSDTHVQTISDKPRIHMVLVRYKDHGPAVPLYRTIIDTLRNGSAGHVIYTRTLRQTFRWNETAWQAFRDNYCRVPSADGLYGRANAELYRYQPAGCADRHRPSLNGTLVGDDFDDSPP